MVKARIVSEAELNQPIEFKGMSHHFTVIKWGRYKTMIQCFFLFSLTSFIRYLFKVQTSLFYMCAATLNVSTH